MYACCKRTRPIVVVGAWGNDRMKRYVYCYGAVLRGIQFDAAGARQRITVRHDAFPFSNRATSKPLFDSAYVIAELS